MSQYEQENDLGLGGGEMDDETLAEAVDDAAPGNTDEGDDPLDADAPGPGPWAKASSGDVEEP